MTSRNLQTAIATAVGLAVVALFFLYGPLFLSMGNEATSAPTEQLIAQDERIGTGAEATVGKVVVVHYTGRFDSGQIFDTSSGKDPISFTLGAGEVVAGWDQGLQGMKVGGKRLLIVPPSLGYGPNDYGPIPGNSTLIFEVELVGVE